jgi:TolB-like protein
MSLTSFITKGLALAVACLLCGTACSAHTRPASEAAPGRGTKPHIAVLPLVNMSGQPAPVKGMRQALIERLVAEGAAVLDDEALEKFMARHRMRNVDGIDSVTAQALHQEAGMDSVIITTLERYADAHPPAIAMTSRLVSAEDTPIILWMETVALSGDDSPGVLGLGLIDDIFSLQKIAFDRLIGSFEKYLAGATYTLSGRGERRFRPKTVYGSSFMRPGGKYSVAVAPFLNKSGRDNADSFLALHFMSQLTKEGNFNVIDPGTVREKLLFFRFIMQEGLSMRQADLIHDSLQADLILAGKVLEYEDAEGTPRVEFSALVFDRKKKKVVWASWSFNRGDDDVSFFDWGRVSTAGALASKMTQAVVWDLSTRGTSPDKGLPKEPSSAKGPWDIERDHPPAQ